MKTFLTATAILLLAAAAAVPAQAQLQVQVEGAADPSFVGGTVVFDSDGVGQRVSKRLFLNFEPVGGQSITLRSVLVRGSQDFSYEIKDVPRLPVVIRNELTLDMFVLYLPTGPGPAQATLELTIQRGESDFEPTDTKYTVNLVGRVPSFTLSYVLPGGSPRPVPVAGTVEFGNKGTRAPTEATLVLANNGSGPGIVQNLSVTGSAAFSLTSPPSVPLRIDPGEVLDLQVAFAPQGTQRYRGQISFDFGVIKQQYNIAGTGGDLLQFSILPLAGDGTPGSATMIESGTEIRFGTGAVKVDVVGRNIMQHSQLVRSIAVSGPFAITNAPTLPATLQSQETLTLSLEPRGIMVGEHSGTLMVGDAHFPLAITVPELPPFRFSQAGGAVTGAEAVPMQLSLTHPYPVEVTGALSLDFFPSDFADDPGVQWSTGGRQAAFRILPGQTEAVFDNGSTTVEFQASTASGEIVVAGRFAAADWGLDLTPDAAPEVRFSVDIPELPQVRYSRSGGMVTGGDEIPMGLSLAQPYPVDLDGSLSLQFVPMEFDNDPLVQWATGGREVAFTIPAGTTSAVFGEDTATVSFRTGGTPGEVVITARFRAESWRNLDVTPDTPPEARFDVQVPDLPEVRFSRSGATVRATDRVSLGLAIAEPFPVDLEGTMMLAFMAEDFEGDPSLQWETGGRQVAFTIAAGETAAMFPADAEEVEFRAARVQGEVVVSAQFRAPEWNADLTPDDAPQVRFNVEIQALPQVSYSSTGGTVPPAEQIPVGLSIARPYPTDIVGVLILEFETRVFTTDPSVQWATGGRFVPFTIARGATTALFSLTETTNAFQTGTVAGDIVITARFVSVTEGIPPTVEEAQAQPDALEITPDTAPEVRFTVMEGAPVLQRVTLGAVGQGQFTLQVTGYATPRSVDSIAFEFTGTPDASLQTPSLQADVTQAFRAYYGGSQSVSVGSQFTASAQFTLEEGVFEDLVSVSVNASNGSGESNSVSVSLN